MVKKKRVVFSAAALALLLVCTLRADQALAYFTTWVTASGSHSVSFGKPGTEIEEEVVDWTKQVSVVNTGTADCYVRVKAYAGSQYPLVYSQTGDGKGTWSQGEDEYWYYSQILKPGETASGLEIKIPEQPADAVLQDFNVVVVQEYTVVLYDGDGNPYADWSLAQAGGEEAAVPGNGRGKAARVYNHGDTEGEAGNS